MEKLFESKVMIKLQEFGQNIGKNKFLSAIQTTMMSLIGVIMVGAVSVILSAVGSENILGLFKMGDSVYNFIFMPYQFTINMLSVWLTVLFAYNYAKKLKMEKPLTSAVNSLICFMLVAGSLIVNPENGSTSIDMTYLGAGGMFVSFIVVFISIHIEKMCEDKKITIKMPDSVPPSLISGFTSLIPLLLNMIVFVGLSVIVTISTDGSYTICSGFMALLSAPLSALTSLGGMFVLCIFCLILWCFGIHGTMVLSPIIITLTIQATTANGAAFAAGKPLQFYPVFLLGAMTMVGGTGNSLPLALLGLRSKSKQISAVSKLSIIPALFGVNEPITFGMPIMYNPILCIPFILNVPVVMILTYFAYQIGFLQPAWISVMGLFPMGVAGYLSTLRWQNAIWDYLMIIPSAIIWYPFFKIYEKQLIAKETAAEALEVAEKAE